MATYTIDQIGITRTKTTLKGSDILELQIKDGGVDDEKSAKVSIDDLNGGSTPLRYKCLLSQNAPITTTTDPTMVAGQIWTLEAYNAADAATIAALELISGTLYAIGSKYRSATDQTLNVNVATTFSYDGSPYIVSTDVNGDFAPFVNTLGGSPVYSYPSTAGRFRATLAGAFPNGKTMARFDKSRAWTVQRTNDNQLDFKTYSDYFSTEYDGLMNNWLFEIEVYP